MGKKNKNQMTDHDVAPKRRRASGEYEAGTDAATGKKQKLSKRERKELKKQQAETEKRLVAEGVISPRVRYSPRSFLWNIIAVCLAFFLGIFFAIGAIVFAGAKSSVKSILGIVGVEYQNIITEEYAQKSLIDLFHDAMNDLGGGLTSLNALGKYTPLVNNTVETLSESLSPLGIHLNADELMNVEFSNLGSYFQDNVLHNICLGETLGLTPDSSPLMIGLCYGEEGVDFDVVDGAFQMKEGKHATTISDLTSDATGIITRVTVEAALNVTASSPAAMRYLAYGSENETYKIEDGQIVMLTNTETGETFPKKTLSGITEEGSDVIGDARLGDLMDMSGANNFMATIKDWHISDLKNSNRINRLRISQIINTEGSTSLMMNAIKDWRINDLMDQDKINSLCIGDVLQITEPDASGNGGSPKILRTLKEATLGNFGDAVNNIRLSDLLDDDLENNQFLRSLQKSTLQTLASDINALTVADIFGEEIYAYSSLEEIQGYSVSGHPLNSYEDFIAYYKSTGRNDKDFSEHRPAKLTLAENSLEKRRIHTGDASQTALKAAWFASDGNGGYTKTEAEIGDIHIEKKGDEFLRYIESKPVVTPVYAWEKVDYDKPESEWEALTVTESAEGFTCNLDGQDYPVQEDGFGYYIVAPAEGGVMRRMDLERTITGYLLNGTVLDEGTPVRYQKPTETEEGYYYAVQRVYVTERYYNESNPAVSYAPGDTTEIYFGTWAAGDPAVTYTNKQVDRYLDGIWYLLLNNTEASKGADTPITALSSEVTQATSLLDQTPLWELYVHNLLSVNTYRKDAIFNDKNLNEYTLANALQKLVSFSFTATP